MPISDATVVTLDVGSSSVRTLLFDAAGQSLSGFGGHLGYSIQTSHDGGSEVDADLLFGLCVACLDTIHGHLVSVGIRPMAVAFDTFWHSFLGVDASHTPTTPIDHLFDTRSHDEALELAKRVDAGEVHRRTGCRLHPSYWPSKLLWLSKNRAEAFGRTAQWISFGEYVFLKLFGEAVASTSMVSASGLWDQSENQYDGPILDVLPVKASQLCSPDAMDRPMAKLLAPYGSRWPLFDGIPWFPALGDGACSSVGSGCTKAHQFALMVGTSGAMRAIETADKIVIPDGLWCYRVDRRRFILGGALSNGGDVYAWLRRNLLLPSEAEAEAELERRLPGAHCLLFLPFFAGERSPYWRSDLRATVTGLDLSTSAMDILQASLESVALRFRTIFDAMTASLGAPEHVVASGGALLASRAWLQIMSDAMETPLMPCLEPEATSRGAALLAFERLGVNPGIDDLPALSGPEVNPITSHAAIYRDLNESQLKLFHKLYPQSL